MVKEKIWADLKLIRSNEKPSFVRWYVLSPWTSHCYYLKYIAYFLAHRIYMKELFYNFKHLECEFRRMQTTIYF